MVVILLLEPRVSECYALSLKIHADATIVLAQLETRMGEGHEPKKFYIQLQDKGNVDLGLG